MDDITLQLLGSCIATIIPLLFVYIVIKDVNSRYILLCFCWGSLVGVLAYIGNSYFVSDIGQIGATTNVAPIIEEILKALPLLFFLRKKSYPITLLIVYCALASGVGFSIQETIFYFSMSAGMIGDVVALIVRTLTTSLMHGMSTAIFGIGLLMLQNQRYILLPVIFGLLAISESIHSLFNLLLPTRFSFIAMIIPIVLYLMGLIMIGNLSDKTEVKENSD